MTLINNKRNILFCGMAVLSIAVVILASALRQPDPNTLSGMSETEQTAYLEQIDHHNKEMPYCFLTFGVEAECPMGGALPLFTYLGLLGIFAAVGIHFREQNP